MTAKSRKTHVSVLETAHRLPDSAVDDVPEVQKALQALAEARQRYQNALGPSRAAQVRLDAVRADLAAAKARIALAKGERVRHAVAIVEGDVAEAVDDELVAEIARLERAVERAGWALPALEARVEELQAPLRRAADREADCARALADARLDAKIVAAEGSEV